MLNHSPQKEELIRVLQKDKNLPRSNSREEIDEVTLEEAMDKYESPEKEE